MASLSEATYQRSIPSLPGKSALALSDAPLRPTVLLFSTQIGDSCTKRTISGIATQVLISIVTIAPGTTIRQLLYSLAENTWDSTICTSNAECALNCALEGADYSTTYGISTSGNALTLKFTQIYYESTNIGSRDFLLSSDIKYEIFKLLNQEFTVDVDVSQLPCGLNGALYFSSMDADGGSARFPTNKAGAKYGTGYCDSKCPRNLKFIDGQVSPQICSSAPIFDNRVYHRQTLRAGYHRQPI